MLKCFQMEYTKDEYKRIKEMFTFPIQPIFLPEAGEGVPEELADWYKQANQCLEINPDIAATCARRILQTILEENGYPSSKGGLYGQINAVLEETDPNKCLPNNIKETLHAVRRFGNFGAHPITRKSTLQIIKVEPHEAEWCIKIVERLFQHYYIQPLEDKKILSELEKKTTPA